jgi:hypothetical protein
MNAFGVLIIAAQGFWVYGVIAHWGQLSKSIGIIRFLVRVLGDKNGRVASLLLAVLGVIFGVLVLIGKMEL